MERNLKELVAQMTLEEKAGMCSGLDFWHLKGVERLGIPSVMVSDGPHGLRKQDESGDHLGINDNIKAVCFIDGVQTHHVGTSIKHFAANNQEFNRMSCSSDVDERTLREIYLPAFETAVKKAQPYTVMCSYNKINGTFASENPWLLTDVL